MTVGEVLGIDEFNFINCGLFADQAFDADDWKFGDHRSAPKEPKDLQDIYSVDDLDLDHIDDDIL